MNYKLFISRRYLFSKKSQSIINIISAVSAVGVAVGTAALIVILSVFNGFDGLIHSLFNTFDAELKILPVEGKTFTTETPKFEQIRNFNAIAAFSKVIEENVLLKYGDKLHPAIIKGVSPDYIKSTGIDTMLVQGDFILKKNNIPYVVVGQGVAYYLSIGLNFITPIIIYVPKRGKQIALNAENAFNSKIIFPSGIFSIQQDFDSKYIIAPIDFVRDLLNYKQKVSAVELKLKANTDVNTVKKKIKKLLGPKFYVKDRFEQHELFYKVMKSEKWAIFLILSFILLIASFNIIGSITMLILDKKRDIFTLKSLGADNRAIKRIFLYEGWFISFIGAIAGLIIGSIVCFLQIKYGFVKLEGSGSFIINQYPVAFKLSDFIMVFVTVVVIGYFAAWLPTRYVPKLIPK